MHLRKVWAALLILIVCCAPLPILAQQTVSDADKAKVRAERDKRIAEMLEQALAEVPALRLPGNRAVVYALAGDIYWRLDQERSRVLFRNVIPEIHAHYQEAAAAKSDLAASSPATISSNVVDIRSEILPVIGRRDPELGLEMLGQTRPPEIAEALARYPADAPPPAAGTPFDQARTIAARERAMEERFIQQAVGSDPEKSVKFIRDSLAKGPSTNVLPVLEMLRQKDAKAAMELGEEVIRKAVEADLGKNEAHFRTAVSILQYAARPVPPASGPRSFNFSQEQANELANRIVSAYLQNPSPSASMNSLMQSWATPILERFVPERSAQLKLRVTQNLAKAQTPAGRAQQNRLWNSNSTAEELVAVIPKVQNASERAALGNLLRNKLNQITDDERVRKLIDQIPDAGLRSAANEQFESNRASRAASAGKLDEARGMIETLSNRRMRVQRLVGLAMQYHRKGSAESIEQARAAMNDARALVRDVPESGDDLQDQMEIVRGYAVVEPDVAFRMFEQLIPQFNEIIRASAVLDKFARRSQSFDKGEIVMRISGTPSSELLLFRYIPHLQMMGRADLERMHSMADRFERNDTRALVRLLVLRAIG